MYLATTRPSDNTTKPRFPQTVIAATININFDPPFWQFSLTHFPCSSRLGLTVHIEAWTNIPNQSFNSMQHSLNIPDPVPSSCSFLYLQHHHIVTLNNGLNYFFKKSSIQLNTFAAWKSGWLVKPSQFQAF